jgi:hypothetical protein
MAEICYRLWKRGAGDRWETCEACGAEDCWQLVQFAADEVRPYIYECVCGGSKRYAVDIVDREVADPSLMELLVEVGEAVLAGVASLVAMFVTCGCGACKRAADDVQAWLEAER